MEELFVSIIIPVYKVETYIERCLISVMRQDSKTMPIECILVDDCSPDNSMIIAENMINNYSGGVKFKVMRHEKNQGLSAARNTGMSMASGDYLFFLDSDDYLLDDCLIKFYNVIKKYPDLECVKGNHVGRIRINVSKIPSSPINNDTLLNMLYMSIIPVMAWNTLIKRTVVQEWDLMFKPGLLYEDNLWSAALFRHVNSFLFIPDTTYYYEDNNNNSITGNKEISIQAKSLPHFIIMVDELLSSYDKQCFVPYTFFVTSRLMQMIDLILKDRQIDSNLINIVFKQRKKLFKYTLQHHRIILALFVLLLYPPLWHLMKFRLFRKNYDRLVKVVYKMAIICDNLHR